MLLLSSSPLFVGFVVNVVVVVVVVVVGLEHRLPDG